MKLRTRRLICCQQCGKEFGGPTGGEYEGYTDDELADYLAEEALNMFWIRVVIGTDDVLVCTKECVSKWLKSWPHQNEGSGR